MAPNGTELPQMISTALRLSHRRPSAARVRPTVRVEFVGAATGAQEEDEAAAAAQAVASPPSRWGWKRGDAAAVGGAAAATPTRVAGGLFSGSPRRMAPERVIEMRHVRVSDCAFANSGALGLCFRECVFRPNA